MKKTIATGLVLAGLNIATPAYADDAQLRFPSMPADMNYCERVDSQETQCFTTGRGSPSKHPKYTFTPDGRVTESLPNPNCDKDNDCEYLDSVVYTVDSSGDLTSALVTVERRIGDRFIQKQDLQDGNYRLSDSRTGEDISLCVRANNSGGYACSGTQFGKKEHPVTDKETTQFQRYAKRLDTIMSKFNAYRPRK